MSANRSPIVVAYVVDQASRPALVPGRPRVKWINGLWYVLLRWNDRLHVREFDTYEDAVAVAQRVGFILWWVSERE